MTDDIKQLYTLYKKESCDFDRIKRLFLLLENVFRILKTDYSLNALEKEKDETDDSGSDQIQTIYTAYLRMYHGEKSTFSHSVFPSRWMHPVVPL